MKRLLAAIRFLTVLPMPGRLGTDQADLAASVPFFPLVGLLLGGLAGAIAFGLSLIGPPMLTAAIVIVAMLAFSGGLHMDGLSDTADGLLSSRPRDRALEIMRDSHVGPMGVMAVVCVLMLKFAALASIAPKVQWLAVFLMPLAGRCVMVLHLAALPYVREQGLASVFSRTGRIRSAAESCATLLALSIGVAVLAGLARGNSDLVAWGMAGLIAAIGSLTIGLLLAVYFRRKIGGATGDTYGAACEIGEIVPAVALAICCHLGLLGGSN